MHVYFGQLKLKSTMRVLFSKIHLRSW